MSSEPFSTAARRPRASPLLRSDRSSSGTTLTSCSSHPLLVLPPPLPLPERVGLLGWALERVAVPRPPFLPSSRPPTLRLPLDELCVSRLISRVISLKGAWLFRRRKWGEGHVS
jgi:hypothetical protein